VVNQFQGDGMLVTFNIPVPDVHHADEAVEAATAMIRAMEATDFGAESLRIRIGVATGVVLAGNVGAGSRLSYTVHGDAVNLAARLEQMNKAFGSRVLISGATAAQLTRGQPIETVGAIEVRGKQHPVPVYRAIVGKSQSRSP
jgi:class 3 adenylate cyclase